MKQINKIINYFVIFAIVTTIVFNLNSITTLANEYTFYITPSKIYDKTIQQGQSETYSIKVGSRILNEENESLKDIVFDVEVTAELQGEDGLTIAAEDIFKISKTEFTLSPGKSETIDITVTAPNDIISGNYIGYVNFTKKERPQSGENINATINNVLRIPMYIFMGTEEEYNNIIIDFEILNNYITVNGEEPTSIINETLHYIKKLLNPFNIINVVEEIMTRPYYNIIKENEQILDLNSNIYVPLEKVSTQKKITTDKKYFNYSEEYLNKKLNQAKVEDGNILLIFEDDTSLTLKAYGDNSIYIKNQLGKISSNKKDVNLQYLLENLLVPMNYNYLPPYPYLLSEVNNKSNIPLTLASDIEVFKNNDNFYKNSTLSSTIKPNSSSQIKNMISDAELTEGKYNVNTNFKMREASRDIESNFKVENVRNKILILCILFLIIYLLVLITLLICIYRLIKKKKTTNQIKENDENESK